MKTILSNEDFLNNNLLTFGATHYVKNKKNYTIVYSPKIASPTHEVIFVGSEDVLIKRGLVDL